MIERELSRAEWLPLMAKGIIREHRAHGTCRRCRDGACESLSWARDAIKALRLAGNRPDRY
ncbi:hypothetical protein ACFOOK_07600 [Micromonospora krabiensis]|uniref:Uncharacterized protein n=1 Tax=Micromonospora krabiensis TaxID=307121 RepID=A0A1C3NC18_9ACTN|nr:hypothetical protein [Micromonospora krabiensis]SBV30136.1 hypothetical protein GA0070620_5729 [Micromonospora krabiensis]